MKYIRFNEYGSTLTGREFGFDVFKKIQPTLSYPVGIDFSNISALGSSFAEEIILPIANNQKKKLYIKNASSVVMSCLIDLAEEQKLEIIKTAP